MSSPDEVTGCDVAVAPGMIFGVGCSMEMVIRAIRRHRDAPAPVHFRYKVLARVIPPDMLQTAGDRVALRVAALPYCPSEKLIEIVNQVFKEMTE